MKRKSNVLLPAGAEVRPSRASFTLFAHASSNTTGGGGDCPQRGQSPPRRAWSETISARRGLPDARVPAIAFAAPHALGDAVGDGRNGRDFSIGKIIQLLQTEAKDALIGADPEIALAVLQDARSTSWAGRSWP